jgi:hypothetical protein
VQPVEDRKEGDMNDEIDHYELARVALLDFLSDWLKCKPRQREAIALRATGATLEEVAEAVGVKTKVGAQVILASAVRKMPALAFAFADLNHKPKGKLTWIS